MTKLLIWKCYHSLISVSMSDKQNDTKKVLPPRVVPTTHFSALGPWTIGLGPNVIRIRSILECIHNLVGTDNIPQQSTTKERIYKCVRKGDVRNTNGSS